MKRRRDDAWRGHVFYSKDHVASMWEELYDDVLRSCNRE